MIRVLLVKLFGSKNERELKRLFPVVGEINRLEPRLSALPNAELQAQTGRFKEQLAQGRPLDEILPEAFATVREVSKRVLGMRHFDVQLIGGMVLHSGRIAEMKTGEGKTLVATLPAYLNALTGHGVHVVTVNDYLARRDTEWMGRIYGFLGLRTGCVVHGLSHSERRDAYAADITYGQNNEFGFDYLRDNMVVEEDQIVQRRHHFAIVDEVDSILIDEARTPLIISGPAEDRSQRYVLADELARKFRPELHYTVDLKSRQAMLSDDGVRFVEESLQLENLYDPRNIEVLHCINQALRAHAIFKRDVDYVVRNGQVIIVDEFTGRLMPGRRWSDGLHQAIEAKERVRIVQESQTVASITFQNYFRMYKRLSGMTGTADTEAVEFKKIYNLDVVVIPTNKEMIRQDYPDVVFANEKGKFKAVVAEIEERHKTGQPVLVGTASIVKSELLSELLTQRGIPHHVLNAKHHEREAEIVAQAGRLGAVTISTNMAGRGTDIVLGGNPEFMAAADAGTKDPNDSVFQDKLSSYRALCAEERKAVLKAGGLHIIGTERHESRRIDNQLRGRSGRQGDPGSSRFYVSLEDDLMKRFGGERMQAWMVRAGLREDDAIEGRLVSRAIENAQKKVEAYHFDIRKQLLEYDDVMNKQREVIYKLRNQILRAEDIEKVFLEMIPDVVEDLVLQRANEKDPPARWKVKEMFEHFSQIFGLRESGGDFVARQERADQSLAQEIFDTLQKKALNRYEERKRSFGAELMLRIQRTVILGVIDHFWRDHLSAMDHLREGMGLRGFAQKNPLHEYQREAFELFSAMVVGIKTTVVNQVFTVEILTEEQIREREERLREEQRLREAREKAIHEDVLETPGKPGYGEVEGSADGLNREQRRWQKQHQRFTTPQFTREDYSPTSPPTSPAARAKKEAARKKNKAAREARKRSR